MISLLIVAAYIVLFVGGTFADQRSECKLSGEELFKSIVGTFFCLASSVACIWWGDELGEGLTGARFGFMQITESTPGPIIRFMGWVFLLLPGILILLGYSGILNRLI